MANAIRRLATVKPGGVIEIRSPELTPGARVEVIVLLEGSEARSTASLRSMIGSGKGAFANPEEAIAFIRRERDAWD